MRMMSPDEVENCMIELENMHDIVNLGATRPKKSWINRTKMEANREIEGEIDDYIISEKSVSGMDLVYNR